MFHYATQGGGGADKANKGTCMFDANIFMKTNICPQFNITILSTQ